MKFKLLTLVVIAAISTSGQLRAESMNASVPADPDTRVDVSNVRGSIAVSGWDKNEVEVTGSLGEGSVLKFSGQGSRVSVRIETPDAKGWFWWGRGGPTQDTRLEVRVPRAAALDVDAVSAKLRIEGMVGSREVTADSVSGDVNLKLQSSRVKISSVSGDIDFDGAANRADLETVSGDLVAKGLSGEIDLQTVSGDARLFADRLDRLTAGSVSGDLVLELKPQSGARIKAETLSGKLRVYVPAELSARISVETFSGDIRSDFGAVEKPGRGPGRTLRATAGTGAATLDIESFSGDVEIRKL